ncbi:hypothetical protein [Cohnella zeiphila]|uniref:hypothetical protein n=1 Tax=Cohnella zeiphila TaxID=2761120 RepID=UPI001EE378F1|nr:hypothetical protein [Cohnella zeiphila]
MARRIRARGSWRRLGTKLPTRLWRILRSPRVSVADKLLFVVPVLLYWVLPDLMPFIPIDDIAVTLAAAGWYVGRMERKYGPNAFE